MENTATIINKLLGWEAFATTCISEFEKMKQQCYLLRKGLEDSSSGSAEQEDPKVAEAREKGRLGLRTRTNRRILK